MSEIYIVTGANSGIGLDTVRRLAIMPSTKKVYMGCRAEKKAANAIALLKKTVEDTSKLSYIHFDANSPKEEIYDIVKSIGNGEQITGLVLNAGGIGHDKSRAPTGPNNVLECHQINLIGHIQLVEALKQGSKMAPGCKIVFSGSEGARGVPTMGIAEPEMGDTSEWYEKHLKGDFSGYDQMAVYATTKGFAVLYFAEWARQNPEYKVWVVSPGGTAGTAVGSNGAVPLHMKIAFPILMRVMKLFRMVHGVEGGSDRYVQALSETNHNPSGTFLASKKGMSGEVVDQTTLPTGKKYGDQKLQKVAFDALHPYALRT